MLKGSNKTNITVDLAYETREERQKRMTNSRCNKSLLLLSVPEQQTNCPIKIRHRWRTIGKKFFSSIFFQFILSNYILITRVVHLYAHIEHTSYKIKDI